MDTLNHDRLHAASGHRSALLRRRAWRPQQERYAWWTARWPALAVTLLLVAMLAAYVQVVRASVEKSVSRQRAVAAHADRVWRCNFLRQSDQRARCRTELDAEQSALAPTAP